MGGAPSRETLVRHIVRDPRVTSTDGASPISDTSTGTSPQAEIVLIPLIPDYFPSSASPLFQQLVHVRREPTVSYYYRDARSTAAEHAVVHDHVGTDKELYNWYMSLSEQRLMETDNELIALSRAGRVVSPVPCAVAFVYNASATPAATAAAAAVSAAMSDNNNTATSPDSNAASGGNKKKDNAKGKQRRGKAGAGGLSNGYMTIENTVRVPHHNLRVRIFGFVGDTRFCPPSMLPSQAAKTPMCLTIFLSKSAGGNHRAQVTLLAAHTYMQQLQEIGILRHVVDGGFGGAAAFTANGASNTVGAVGAGIGFSKTSSSPVSLAAASTDDLDPLAGLRGAGVGSQPHLADADPYRDPYAADPYGTEAHADPYAVDAYDDPTPQQQQQQPFGASLPRGGSNAPLDGFGSTSPSPVLEVAKEIVLRRPVEVIMHRADVPALCYVRELRARMDQDAAAVLGIPVSPAAQAAMAVPDCYAYDNEEQPAAAGDVHAGNAQAKNGYSQNFGKPTQPAAGVKDEFSYPHNNDASSEHSLKRLIQTVIRDEELRGTIDAESMGRVLLWASRFYVTHFEQLVGGEAARLRQELAQRNLSENRLDGSLSLTEDEPRPPKSIPAPGDVWITPHDTYVEVRGQLSSNNDSSGYGGSNIDHNHHHIHSAGHSSSSHLLQHEVENWTTVPAGTVLRYTAAESDEEAHAQSAAAAAGARALSPDAARGAWHVSKNEFAEDILLSLCRNACHASRRAPPADEHWLLNRETGLPEGLSAGLLIWREPAAGQVVYYGTTPDFLKQWVQSGVELEAVYRHHTKKPASSSVGTNGSVQARREIADDGVAAVAEGATATGGVSGQISSVRHSTSITVASASTATAASKGLHSSYEANSPANNSGVSSGPRGTSSKERGKGSGSSSMALYSVHTGFVCATDQSAEAQLGSKSNTSSPTGNGPVNGVKGASAERSGTGSSTEAKKTKARRVRTESSTPAAAVTAGIAASPPQNRGAEEASTPIAHSHVRLSGSMSRYDEARLSRSLPAHQRSHFAIPVTSSRSLARTPNSSTSSISSASHSYTNLGYVDQLGSLSASSSPHSRAAHASSPFAYTQQQPLQQQPDHATMVNLANACWIGVPDPTSRDEANTPTVNVVVKQRRSVRLTPGTSLLDNATAPGHHALRYAPPTTAQQGTMSGSYTRAQPRAEHTHDSNYAKTSTQPITVGPIASGSVGHHASGALAKGSLPIHIFGSHESSSEDGSLRQGGHSPSSQEQSRSLLRGDDALISHATATRADPLTRPPPRQSTAMDVRPSAQTNAQNFVGTPLESSSSLKWRTSNAAQPASMRGASVTFASGSARHSSLLHSSRYQEPCQPVLSRPASLATSELLSSSATSTGSFSRKKEALRPPPLFTDNAAASEKVVEDKNTNLSMPSQNTMANDTAARGVAKGPVLQPASHLISTAPVAVAGAANGDGSGGGDGVHSRSNSAAHTPRQGNLSESSKSSVGSGKYRWDWRGVSWNS